MIYDFVIIGAGAAGSFMTYLLQLNGFHCILLERRTEIDEKTCGGFLTNHGRMILESSGIDTKMLLQQDCTVIHNITETHVNTEKQYHYLEGSFGFGIRRQLLDTFLLQQARNAGAEIRMHCTVQTVSRSGGIVEVTGVKARNIIWAIGARGITFLTDYKHDVNIRSALEMQTFGVSEIIRGKNAHFPLSSDTVRFWYDDDDNGYFWAIPIGTELWNIGYWCNHRKTELMGLFRCKKAQLVLPYLTNIETVRKPKGAFCGNVDFTTFLSDRGCGDIGGFNNPATGEGIAPAFQSCITLMEKINESEKNPTARKV